MPPRKGENSKAVEARDRKASSKKDKTEKESKAKEDAYWVEAGEGSKSKAAAKKAEQDKARIEAAAKKAEAKRLAEEEEAALSKAKPKEKVTPAAKVTAYQLQRQRELDAKKAEEAAREKALQTKREVTEEGYSALVEVENVNKLQGDVEARNVDQAIAGLSVVDGGSPEVDKHPERRLKAAYAAYLEAELPRMREEKPGLKMRQYQDMVWKSWQKSPQNPLVQAALAQKP